MQIALARDTVSSLPGSGAIKPMPADVIVRDRVVHFWLAANQTEDERRALRVAAENIAGVRRVEEHIIPSL